MPEKPLCYSASDVGWASGALLPHTRRTRFNKGRQMLRGEAIKLMMPPGQGWLTLQSDLESPPSKLMCLYPEKQQTLRHFGTRVI